MTTSLRCHDVNDDDDDDYYYYLFNCVFIYLFIHLFIHIYIYYICRWVTLPKWRKMPG